MPLYILPASSIVGFDSCGAQHACCGTAAVAASAASDNRTVLFFQFLNVLIQLMERDIFGAFGMPVFELVDRAHVQDKRLAFFDQVGDVELWAKEDVFQKSDHMRVFVFLAKIGIWMDGVL